MKKLFPIALVAGALVAGWWFKKGTETIDDLLSKNEKLKEAISNLTKEEKVGYAKILKQETVDGTLRTTVRFVELAPDDKTKLSEKEFTVDGDVLYFDGMSVVFPKELVMDGTERSIFLWRRIFGEHQEPANGCQIGEPGQQPARYRDLFEKMGPKSNETFWAAMWELSNDAEALKKHSIRTVHGTATSQKMEPGKVYTFTLTNTGQVTVSHSPDI